MDKIKYPRTPHLPWSQGGTDDDRRLTTASHFMGKQVVVTEKLDGENTALYREHIHARSMDSKDHPSRHPIKAFWGSIRWDIPTDMRLCIENVYATHSIHYTSLVSFFPLIAVVRDPDQVLSWSDTQEWAQLLGLVTVPVLYQGPWDEAAIQRCMTGQSTQGGSQEGYVVRVVDVFPLSAFDQYVAKFVRKDHVQTDENWMSQPMVPNLLKP